MSTTGRVALAAAMLLAACKGKEPGDGAQGAAGGGSAAGAVAGSAGSASGSAAAGSAAGGSAGSAAGSTAAADWTARCEAALAGAPKVTPVRRIQSLLDGCRPCGDWTPLLRWGTPAIDGGPPLAAIEAAMEACSAYCKPDAKVAFLGVLEDSRGKRAPKPWRLLGEACGEAVSAKPDTRYMSAPYFALDRIARAAAAHPKLSPLLAAIELPLPPLASTGGSFVLATSPVTKPEAGPAYVTVSMTELTAGTLPRARLGAAGVTVTTGDVPYPGAPVTAKALAAALDKLAPDPAARIAVIAPKELPARRLVDVALAAGTHPLVLAVEAAGAPGGWHLPGTVPVVLGAKEAPGALRLAAGASVDDALHTLKSAPAEQLAAPPAIAIDDAATVENLAKLLGMLAYRDVPAASLARATAPAKRP